MLQHISHRSTFDHMAARHMYHLRSSCEMRLFWTNMMPPSTLQAALPTLLPPSPSLDTILRPYHIPTKPGHTDRHPFSPHNQLGWARTCMPTVRTTLVCAPNTSVLARRVSRPFSFRVSFLFMTSVIPDQSLF